MNLWDGMYSGIRPLAAYRKQLSAHSPQWAQILSAIRMANPCFSRRAHMAVLLISAESDPRELASVFISFSATLTTLL
jgi:hypothetical protein